MFGQALLENRFYVIREEEHVLIRWERYYRENGGAKLFSYQAPCNLLKKYRP